METVPGRKFLTVTQALARLKKYCAFQERSQYEVRNKLLELGQRGNDLENIMVNLIEDGFLNEERFAIAFARGKFRMKGWGRNRISQELKRKRISEYCINKAMREIDNSDYRESLLKELKKKAATIKDENIFSRKQKLSAYLIRKGYEPDIVWEAVNRNFEK
jgi:regulatory protein